MDPYPLIYVKAIDVTTNEPIVGIVIKYGWFYEYVNETTGATANWDETATTNSDGLIGPLGPYYSSSYLDLEAEPQ
jgi:hypothetical protein